MGDMMACEAAFVWRKSDMSENRQTGGSEAATIAVVIDDFETCYRFMRSRDPRYDGFFFVGVKSTGIYCRPRRRSRRSAGHGCA